MSTADYRRQRVTVVSPVGQHQVDLPVDVPVSGFLPDLLVVAGLHPSQGRSGNGSWQLEDADGRTLAADGTLAAHGIRPGSVIQLRGADWPGPGTARLGDADSGHDAADGGAGFARDQVRLSSRAARPPVVPASAEDGLTPLQRASAALPKRVGRSRRLIAVAGAFLQRPPPAAMPRIPPDRVPGGDATTAPHPAGQRGPGAGQPDPATGQLAGAEGQRAARDEAPPDGFAGAPRLLPIDLTLAAAPSRADCARARWRELDQIGQLDRRIAGPRLRHCATIAVVSPKGGVGKTTVTALLGTLFSLLRRDPIVAVDTNPDFGSLGRVLTPDETWYVDDLARLVAQEDGLSLTALDSHLGRAVHGLLVVPAPTDPLRMAALDEDAYRQVITRLKDFFSLILLDCGTGLQDPASAAAIAAADQVVLLTDAQPATASLVAQSAELLHHSGRPITVVVNRMPSRGTRLDLDQLSRYLPAARGVVVIPDEMTAAARLAGASFDWRDAPGSWQLALRQLAVVLVSDWQRLGLAGRRRVADH